MSSENAECGEALVYFLCDCDVGEEHELFDEVVGFHHFVHFHIGGTVGFLLESDFDLSGS